MAYSAATYKGDGSQSIFMIPFDYLQKDFVKVTINEVDKVYAQDYNVDGRELSFPTAPPSGSIIKVYRETPTDRMVKWNEGSVLTSSNMTTQQIQELHLIEETTYNLNSSAMVKTEDNHKWEGQYLPITHVGNPTDDSDVVNLGTIKKEETGFLASVRSQLDKWLADLGTTHNNYIKSLKESFDSYVSFLKNQFDTYTASLLNDFNNYKDTLLNKYNEYLASLTATKDAVKDSEANASKYKDEAKSASASAKASEVNAKASEVAAAESAKQAAAHQINADWNETNADSKAYIKNKPDVILKSDLASSVSTSSLTVTGETSVPTANEGNSSNTIASTEFVAKSLAKLVDSAPETMNTLNELAKALGNDPNFATTVINELGKKLNSNEAESTYVKQGGVNLWNALHNNTTSNLKGLSNAQWSALGFFSRFFTTANSFENQPSRYGQLINISANTGDEATQLFIEQPSGKIYFRGGNSSTAIKDIKFEEVAYWNGNKHLVFPNGAEMWVA
nr:MAG TPA: tail fiber protein [Caudoviricetes sp.]